MAKKFLVEYKDYNGYKNVKFVMGEKDYDFRMTLKSSHGNIRKIAEVDVKKGHFSYNGLTFKVFADGSVKA